MVPEAEKSAGRDEWTDNPEEAVVVGKMGMGEEGLLGVPGLLAGVWRVGCSYQTLEAAAVLVGQR